MDLSLSRSDKLLIMLGEYAVSAYKKNMHYYFFDSHSRSNSGEIAQENGTSVLLEFDSSASLMHYLKHMIPLLCSAQHFTVEILPVTIAPQGWLQAYLNEQEARSVKKREYNRKYKQQQRKSLSFKLNEKQEIIKYISTRRADPKFRAVENEQNLARIHKKRASPEFREAERKKRRYSRTKGRNPEPTAAGNVQKPVYKQGQDSDRKYCNIERQRGFGTREQLMVMLIFNSLNQMPSRLEVKLPSIIIYTTNLSLKMIPWKLLINHWKTKSQQIRIILNTAYVVFLRLLLKARSLFVHAVTRHGFHTVWL